MYVKIKKKKKNYEVRFTEREIFIQRQCGPVKTSYLTEDFGGCQNKAKRIVRSKSS